MEVGIRAELGSAEMRMLVAGCTISGGKNSRGVAEVADGLFDEGGGRPYDRAVLPLRPPALEKERP